jgi:hypothetical protein
LSSFDIDRSKADPQIQTFVVGGAESQRIADSPLSSYPVANACTYCHGTHLGVAEACGVAPDLITALLADIETAPLEPRMKPILRYARKLTLSPARMTEADAASVYDVGWGDDALYSTVLVTALFNFYNRLVDGVGLNLPDGYIPEAAKRLSTKGYDVFAQMAQT